MSEFYNYTAIRKDNSLHIRIERDMGYTIIEKDMPIETMNELFMIVERYRLVSWDGFDKTDQYVMDGNSFTFSMTLSGNKQISAHGNNVFPNNYAAAHSEIVAFFNGIAEAK